jgi:DNA gyrase subunit A
MAKEENENNKEETQKNLTEEENAENPTDDKEYEAEVLEKETINLKDLDENRQIGAEISTEMKRSYIDYAMSVIVSRALPSTEDGLKPVHRRILYAMKLMGLEKGMTKKCARIVGDTMGKFHPHGDMAIYDALVRMAQDFSLRYPLVHGQGNFGSMDGDNAAASRYTEAKLDKIGVALLEDLDKNTVRFVPNFDNSVDEPELLPGKVPNLLINGSSGIAVGMATNIPPHNLIEVCDGIAALIDKPTMTVTELMEIVKGPDLPTGGVIVAENLKQLYETGRGGFVVRGKVSTESDKDRESIIITEVPYQVNKADLVKSIAELVRDKKLPDISDIRDESSKGKVRVVIELKKGADAKFTINRLYKSTTLQTKFDAVLIALVNNVPQLLTL